MFVSFTQRFESQVAKNPESNAVISPVEKLAFSYEQLNAYSNQVADYLSSFGLVKNDVVGFLSDRTIRSYAVMLGLLKLGVVIVPMDLEYPTELLDFMAQDSGMTCIVSNISLTEKRIDKVQLINLEQFLQQLDDFPLVLDRPSAAIAANDFIYIIYTSGSTGKPKGICMSHGAVSEFLSWEMNYYDYLQNEKVLQFAPLNFDIFFQECLTSWSTGGQLVILPKEYRSQPDQLLNFIIHEQVNKVILPYVMFVQLAQTAQTNNLLPGGLKKIISTGEALITTAAINFLIKNLAGCKFYNLYGASENQIVSIYQLDQDEVCKVVSIGKPVPNSAIFILDENKKPVEVGEVGILYVASNLLCSGYLNRKNLTEESFIANPFQTNEERLLEKNPVLYKTGDMVRYLSDGNLEYIGRNDFQIKIRGYRIELGEIESTLLNFSGIKQSVVIAKEYKNTIEGYANNKYLIAYYVSDKKLDERIILDYLASQLPVHMVPTVLIHLVKLPLTLNGKVDKKALPEPEFVSQAAYVAPSNQLEETVCQLWQKAFAWLKDPIGVDDSFFALGGHSILAIFLVNELNTLFKTQIPVALFLRFGTIRKIVEYVQTNINKPAEIIKCSKLKPEEQRLSFAQERLWFIEKYAGGSTTYNELMVFQLTESTKVDILVDSINSVLAKHEILRTVIRETSDGLSYQAVLSLDSQPLQYRYEQVKSIDELDQKLAAEINYVYDLSTEYPIRVCFFQLENQAIKTANYLSIMVHHIAFDGWSVAVLLRELEVSYKVHAAKKNGVSQSDDLLQLNVQYKDFAFWQREYLQGKHLEQQLHYWRNKLLQFEPLNLMTDYRRPTVIDNQGENVYFVLSDATSVHLRKLAQKMQVSLYSLLLGSYCLMLRIYCNQNDIVLGILAANRHYPEIENLIGFFVNSLPLRIQVDPNATIRSFIESVNAEVIEAQLHQDLPFEKIVADLAIQKDTSRHPIFQVLFEFQSFDADLNNSLLSHYTPQAVLPTTAKFDLNVSIDDSNSQLKGYFNYATNLYQQKTIQGYIETYTFILEQIAQLNQDERLLVDNKIAALTYLNPVRYQQVVRAWNATTVNYPIDTSLAELFERQVEKTPHNIAVIADEVSLTYSELNIVVNRLANYIRQNYSIQPDTIIMLVLDRDIQFLIFMLAVFKAGIAYVPIDPAMPQDRIQSILTESEPLFIATENKYTNLIEKLQNPSGQVCYYENLALDQYSAENLKLAISPYSLAYVIYTSGSTGRPKGAMVEYRGMINHLFIKVTDMHMTAVDKVAQTATQIFDVSVWQFISALMVGGTTVVFKDTAAWDPDKLLEIMAKEQVTVFQTVPSHMYAILPRIENDAIEANKLASLKWMMINGEPLSSEICDRWLKVHPAIPIINAYGPTECSDDVTHYKIFTESNEAIPKIMPISGTLGNTQIYITDEYFNPVPIGAIGEIVVGGVGVGRGYLNRPELTAEKFVLNPFAMNTDSQNARPLRLYRTGDLARYLHDETIEYISRKDFQVKIRGYRIELGEVEVALMTYADIKQAVALVHKQKEASDGAYLVGYYVAERNLDHDAIYSHLRTLLPEYMVPAVLVYLQELPLTMNGKLDRKALPEPKLTGTMDYVAPRTELEQAVAVVWAEILRLAAEQVSIEDDFFRLGGDSIVSIQLVSRLRQRLQLTVSVKDIFTHRTISRLYDAVLSKVKNAKQKIVLKTEQGCLRGELDLLPVQQWFFNLPLVAPHHWNQSFLVKTPALDIEKLKQSLHELFDYHDAFRLRYQRLENARYQQFYSEDAVSVELQILDVSSLSQTAVNDILTQWQSEFSLQAGPLYNIGYLTGYLDGSARIYFALHHLIVDTVSWRILVKDLQDLYGAKDLSMKGSSYRQWVTAVKEYQASHADEALYWQDMLADYDANNLFKTNAVTQQISFGLDKQITQQLLTVSGHAYHTQINDLLLTALAMALTKVTNKQVNHIVLEGHGREEIDPCIDISRTLGWFTTLYPVRLQIQTDIASSIKYIKEILHKIPTRGLGYGALIGYDKTNVSLPTIFFNYQGQFDQTAQDAWSITSEASGLYVAAQNPEHQELILNGWVIGGELHFDITSRWDQQATLTFSELFQQNLRLVIEHTSQLTRSYVTASDVNYVVNQDYLDRLQAAREIQQVYLANSLQQGFIYHALSQGEVDDAYLVQMVWHYTKAINPAHLQLAWQHAQAKYPALRLRFAWDEELLQIIDKVGQLDWRYVDISNETDPQVRQQKFAAIKTADRQERYDLRHNKLFRVYLIKEHEEHYQCLFSMHHAILDGWSCPLLLNYVHDTYKQLATSNSVAKSIDSSYELAQAYLQTQQAVNQSYWQGYVADIAERADLQGLLKAEMRQQGIQLSDYKHIKQATAASIILPNGLYQQLKLLSQQAGVTLNAIMQYAWHKVLHVYGNSQQTVVGTTVSGRNLPIDDIEYSVGLYINTLPLKVTHQAEQLLEGIQAIQASINELHSRSNVSLASLQQGGMRLFDSLFIYENYPTPENASNDILGLELAESVEKLDYPLGVLVSDAAEKLEFKLQYAGELFSEATIHAVLSLVEHILQQIAKAPTQAADQLTYLTSAQYQQIIYDWNATEQSYPQNQTLQALFEAQVIQTPNNIALVYEAVSLTYETLNERANQLAHYLRTQQSIGPDTLIGLCLERSEDLVLAVLAVLKAGGAYVPLDPNYPAERIRYILEDTQTSLVITQQVHQEKLGNLKTKAKLLLMDAKETQTLLISQQKTNPIVSTQSTDLAYVIYTSGTTGKPKGVMITHNAYVATLSGIKTLYLAGGKPIHTFSLTNYVFDIWGLEYGLPLLSGGSITLGTHDFNHLDCQKYDFIQLTPSVLELTIENFANTTACMLFIGGEPLKQLLLQQALQVFPKIINLYGPTETTIWSTAKLYLATFATDTPGVSIGKALPNEKLYILDKNLIPLPTHAIGELYIGGEGLARGYINNSELTQQKFILNPYQTTEEKQLTKNKYLYKTGDFVRCLADGNIEYIARNDSQIKIRGHRIELAEIESTLLAYGPIRQSVVVVVDKHHAQQTYHYLVAYYVADNPIDEEVLYVYLRSILPEYMIPNTLVHMAAFPLNANGKLEQKSLPVPMIVKKEKYVAPRNDLELQVCHIWSEILGLEASDLSIYADFFDLGGNSILAIRLTNRLNNILQTQLKIADIFAYKNIELICYRINEIKTTYQTIIKLNHATHLPNLFLIHPGAAGCEVYASLGMRLLKHFSCYGVDAYNLYHEPKIVNLAGLAEYYLEKIKEVMQATHQQEYHLLGWSLGGLLALEIAGILEREGVSNIKVYLLDTVVIDENLLAMKNKLDLDQMKMEYLNEANAKGYEKNYVDKIIANMSTDIALTKQNISVNLNNTDVLLFKAMQVENGKEVKEISEYTIKLQYNNIDKVLNEKSNIKLIEILSACHSDILQAEEILASEIVSFNVISNQTENIF